jgi:adenylate cyclase
MWQLQVHLPNSNSLIFPLSAEATSIGRLPDNDITIDDSSVSRYHAKFSFDHQEEKVTITDLDSTNGIFINHQRRRGTNPIHVGDVIRVGNCLVFLQNTEDTQISKKSTAFFPYTRELMLKSIDTNSILLGEIAYQLNTITDLGQGLKLVSRLVKQQLGADKCEIILPEKFDNLNQLGFSASLAQISIRQNAAFIIPDLSVVQDEDVSDSVRTLLIRSVLCVPVVIDNECNALLYIYRKSTTEGLFTQQDLQLAIAISHQASLTIQRMKLLEKIRREQQFRVLLQRFVSPDVANYLIESSGDSIKLPKLRRQHATILFVDIENSTGLAESLEVEEFSQIINEYYEVLTSKVFQYKGLVKYIGDGIMALFGMAESEKDPEMRAITAAMEIRSEIEALSVTGKWGLRFGISINTGPVMAGYVGSFEQGEITVLGDAVNVAYGLQPYARPNRILVGPETAKFTRRRFKMKEFGEIRIKNRDEPIGAYEILLPH